MESNKSTRFAFTAYESQWSLFEVMPKEVAEWGYQQETCPKTNRLHYQGYLRTKTQVRISQLIKLFPGVHFEVARNWAATVLYCKKAKTAVEGTQVSQQNPNQPMGMAEVMELIASNRDVEIIDRQTDKCNDMEYKGDYNKDMEKAYREEYWSAVNMVLPERPGLIAYLSQPNYERAWVKTRKVWIDRQTDRGLKEGHVEQVGEDGEGSLR